MKIAIIKSRKEVKEKVISSLKELENKYRNEAFEKIKILDEMINKLKSERVGKGLI